MKEWNLFKNKLLNSELNSDIKNELQNFDKLLKQNEEEFQRKSREKYNPDDIFKKDNPLLKIRLLVKYNLERMCTNG